MNRKILFLLLGFSVPLALLRADALDFRNSVYVHGTLGVRGIPGDATTAGDGYGPPSGQDDTDFSLGAGWQSSTPFGVELGMDETSFPTVFGEDLSTLYLMPTARFAVHGLFGNPCLNTLGLQIGTSTLEGTPETNALGAGADDGPVPADSTIYGVCYRLEQMVGPRVSVGLEIGYTWAVYSLSGYSPEYYGAPVPSSLNLSGPSLKLSIAIWPIRPFATKTPRMGNGKDAASLPDSPEDLVDSAAQTWVDKGDALMQAHRYARGGACYLKAVAEDPGDRWAWQGLGNSYYYLGQKADALVAYKRADALAGGDPELSAMERKLGAAPGGN